MHFSTQQQVLRDQGIQDLDGRAFIKTLGGLAGGGARVKGEDGFEVYQKRFGSLIDIVNPGNRLKPAHSWHLDANLPQATVMFGFPRSNKYRGAGVFSHAVQLSHQLRDQVPGGGWVGGPFLGRCRAKCPLCVKRLTTNPQYTHPTPFDRRTGGAVR